MPNMYDWTPLLQNALPASSLCVVAVKIRLAHADSDITIIEGS